MTYFFIGCTQKIYPHGWPDFFGEWLGRRKISITKSLTFFQLVCQGPVTLWPAVLAAYSLTLVGSKGQRKTMALGALATVQLRSVTTRGEPNLSAEMSVFNEEGGSSGLSFGSLKLVTKWMLRDEKPQQGRMSLSAHLYKQLAGSSFGMGHHHRQHKSW